MLATLHETHETCARRDSPFVSFAPPDPPTHMTRREPEPNFASHPPRVGHAWIGWGSNIGDRLAWLRSAAGMLEQENASVLQLIAASSIYETRPLGPSTTPFLNAVTHVVTQLAPEALLGRLLDIELRHGRTREQPMGPRTLDLDLLLVMQDHRLVHVASDSLHLPHPRMFERDFVLVPLLELEHHEGGDRLRSLELSSRLAAIAPCDRTVLHPLAPSTWATPPESPAARSPADLW